jgi:murein hydrolase activator
MSPFSPPNLRILLLLTILAPAFTLSGSDPAIAAVINLEVKLREQQEQIQRLSQGIEEQKGRIIASEEKELALLAALERIEQQLGADRGRLTDLLEKINRQEESLHTKQEEHTDLLIEQQELGRQVQHRLTAYYRMGGVGILNVLFSVSSLPDLLAMEEYFLHLLHHDRRMLAAFRLKVEEVAETRKKLERKQEQLAVFRAELEKQEQHTAATLQERTEFLQKIRKEKRLYQRATQELERAAFQLTSSLNKLREEVPVPQIESSAHLEMANISTANQGFAALKGRLQPPVAGTVATFFGDETSTQFGTNTRTSGIGIKTEPGARIKAIYKGRVVHSGYLRGYGNLLIIDHGRQYYSLISRAEHFFIEKEAEVQTGEVIGLMGDQFQLPADGLHFEIRHGAEPEDPLAWLDGSKLLSRH